MNVLALFDGMSGGQIALQRLGMKVDKYFSSEIKPAAIKITKEHFPDTICIGDVTKVWYEKGVLHTENGDFKVKIDLLIGGSPCQDFSIANIQGKGSQGEKSQLFYEYLRIYREVKPKLFLLENVKMKAKSKEELDFYMGVTGLEINSILVSYQNRPRIYWTNIPDVVVPEHRHINFQDYKDTDVEYCRQFKVNKTLSRIRMWNEGGGRNNRNSGCSNITNSEKVFCITRKQDRCPNSGLIEFEDFCRYLTRREIEKAQTLEYGWCDSLSYGQMQDLCGDGWTIDVIAWILGFIK